ncbi:hypothetical protein FEF26_04895 [Nesterenkonia salmonea]|uniref:Uncharacterized protein n=1 Tax=Nesterenkonia salmonea TaxID=1804987 RepID=A0A5R9BD02_9MICC|nr:hypothetical protein [Nesterenkonia salmonea]TLP98496.1 hypothetical protein FEF26_04895 [Nesterenkonia salmonea]
MTTIPIVDVTVEDLRTEKRELEARARLTFEELSERDFEDLTRDQVDILFRLESIVEMLQLES